MPTILNGGGEAGALMRAHDWSASPLGHPAAWPQSLRAVVGLILNSKFPMFVAWGQELGFLYNDSYAEILGAKHPLALGRRFQDIWSEIWDDISPLIERALAGEASYHENLPLRVQRRGYEETAWFTFSYSPVLDESGDVAGMYCAVNETTAQVMAQRQRLEETERLRRLFHEAPSIMAVVRGPDHVYELANSSYLRLIGRTDIIGKSVREVLPELEAQGFMDLLNRVYTTGEPFIGRAVPITLERSRGELEERFIDFIYQPITDADGRVTGIFGEGNDVTDAVRAIGALRESEERLHESLEAARMVAWEWDLASGKMQFSGNAAEVLGASWDNMEDAWRAVHPEDLAALKSMLDKTVSTHGQLDTMIRLIRPDNGTLIWVELKGKVRCDAGSKACHVNGVMLDVTERRRAEEELRRANRHKDEFLAMLAHELRNPLAPISNAAHILKLERLNEQRIRQASNIISRQAEHMNELVNDLLDVSRVTRGLVTLNREALDLNAVAEGAIEQVQALVKSRHHHLLFTPSAESACLMGDRTRLVQVVSNILHNAAKYTPSGGTIDMQVRCRAENVEVVVRDNGVGIGPDVLPYVFDLFTQAERTPDRSLGGLGIGLALVKSLVELHGGSVHAASEGAGKGSEFIIRLPRLAQSALIDASRDSDARSRAFVQPLQIMIVDDNADAAQTLAMLLEAGGHTVSVEYDAHGCLARAQRERPLVLLLDIGLPDMDGYELARRLRALPEMMNATLIALTGYGQSKDRERSSAAGFDHHLVKPADIAQLNELLAQASVMRDLKG